MRRLLLLSAVFEAGTGLGLLAVPSVVGQILLGTPLDASASLTVARVAGAALLALGVACWLARYDTQSCATRGVVSAMVLYNLGAAVILGAAGIQSQSARIALWAVVILHAMMSVWCVLQLLGKQSRTELAP
jgi:hypothetical protein